MDGPRGTAGDASCQVHEVTAAGGQRAVFRGTGPGNGTLGDSVVCWTSSC